VHPFSVGPACLVLSSAQLVLQVALVLQALPVLLVSFLPSY